MSKNTPQRGFDGGATLEDDPPTPLPEHCQSAREDQVVASQTEASSDSKAPEPALADIEDADTEIDMRRMIVGEVSATPSEPIVQPRELASVELSGDEARQAISLAEERRLNDPLTHVSTDRVNLPEPTNRECRMCGAKTTPPTRLRLSIPPNSGLRCDTCGNVFCRDHAVRVSGIIESLLSGARFRCHLCAADENED